MTAFVYRAVDEFGKARRGVVEAGNIVGARQSLRARHFLPITVSPTEGIQDVTARRLWRRRGIGQKNIALVTRQLATLVATDIRLEEALRLVAAQTIAIVAQHLLSVRSAILDGRSFTSALADHPATFPEYFRASISAGEQSGKLAKVLAHLADFVESRYRSSKKLQLALMYPALLAIISLGIMMLLMIYVVPGIIQVFSARNADLPFLTRALVAVSTGISHYGLIAAAVLAAVICAGRRWVKEASNRFTVDRVLVTRWPFSRFTRPFNAARFTTSLASLVTSGVPLVDAIDTAGAITTNLYMRKQILGVATRVREGVSLNRAMVAAAVFPPMLIAIVASGENSGRLAPVLTRAGDDLERDLDSLVATLMALVEPAVLLTMGGIVLLMVLAILLPIIDLNNLAGS